MIYFLFIWGPSGVHAKGSLSIRFEGNAGLSASKLKKVAIDELSDFKKKGFRPADADDAGFQMERAYKNKGYPFAEVSFKITKEERGTVLEFHVKEGTRVLIEKLEITGNAAIEERTIRRVLGIFKKSFFKRKRFFVEGRLNSSLGALRDFYIYRGYMDIKISDPEIKYSENRTRAGIKILIHEGSRYILQGVEFAGDIPEVFVADLRKIVRGLTGRPFQLRIPHLLKGQIVELYGNRGYPEAQVATSIYKIGDEGDVSLKISISSGPLVRINRVRVEGNKKTRKALIIGRMALKSGDVFSLEKKKDSFRNLFRTGFFKKITMEFGEGERKRDLVVKVKEAKTREFFFEAGWGSYERLRGKTGIKDKNIFGSGKIASVEVGLSSKSLLTEVSLTDLWLFNSRMTGDFPVFYRERKEPSFKKVESGFAVHITLPITEFVKYSAEYSFQKIRLEDISAEILQENSEISYQPGSLKMQTIYDTRDDIFIPTSGTKVALLVEVVHPYLASNLSFYKFYWDNRFFKALGNNSTVLAFRYVSGLIIPGAQDVNIPLGERFFNGGENTVRSFSESMLGPLNVDRDPIGGFGINIFNIELRQRFYQAFAGSLFFDAGNITPNFSRSVLGKPAYSSRRELLHDTFGDFFRRFKTGIGIGLQYLLPIGPLRLDAALNPSAGEDESDYVIHFSIGAAF